MDSTRRSPRKSVKLSKIINETPVVVRPTTPRIRRSSAAETGVKDTPLTTTPNKRFPRRTLGKEIMEEVAELVDVTPPPKRTRRHTAAEAESKIASATKAAGRSTPKRGVLSTSSDTISTDTDLDVVSTTTTTPKRRVLPRSCQKEKSSFLNGTDDVSVVTPNKRVQPPRNLKNEKTPDRSLVTPSKTTRSRVLRSSEKVHEEEEEMSATPITPTPTKKTRGGPSSKGVPVAAASLSDLPSPVSSGNTTMWRFNSIGVPECPLPCRESQFEEIWTFMNENITQQSSRCMYVSGVPGTGKTLIVQAVVDCLSRYAAERKPNLKFSSIYVNGLSLGSPDKIWKKFLSQLDKEKVKCTPALALKKLNTFFETKGRLPVVLVVDELDQLLDKKQSILYQLLEWTTKPANMFSLIAIFNTMSLPENALVMRNASRMGFVRCIFSPYTHDQLQLIIKQSLADCKSEKIQDEAIVLLSRKVAAVSGDARRALEIARRAIEIVESGQVSGVMGVNAAFKEIFSSVKIETMKFCSILEQAVLKHLTQELESSGTDEATLMSLFNVLCSNSVYDGHDWTKNQFMGAVAKLILMKLIIAENDSSSMHKKVSLNVPFEDVNYALGLKSVEQNQN